MKKFSSFKDVLIESRRIDALRGTDSYAAELPQFKQNLQIFINAIMSDKHENVAEKRNSLIQHIIYDAKAGEYINQVKAEDVTRLKALVADIHGNNKAGGQAITLNFFKPATLFDHMVDGFNAIVDDQNKRTKLFTVLDQCNTLLSKTKPNLHSQHLVETLQKQIGQLLESEVILPDQYLDVMSNHRALLMVDNIDRLSRLDDKLKQNPCSEPPYQACRKGVREMLTYVDTIDHYTKTITLYEQRVNELEAAPAPTNESANRGRSLFGIRF